MSTIKATTLSDLAGTGPVTLTGQFASKVFCQYDNSGTATTVISGNVSSVTDSTTGKHIINLTTNMSAADTGAVVGSANNSYTTWAINYIHAGSLTSASACHVAIHDTATNFLDCEQVGTAIFGDLA